MLSENDDANKVKRDGWRQGSVLPESLVVSLRKKSLFAYLRDKFLRVIGRAQSADLVVESCSLSSEVVNDSLFIVVTHDCNVTNGSFEKEPYVEIIEAELIPQNRSNGNYEWGKR